MNKSDIIEINGRRYDAGTGKALDQPDKPVVHHVARSKTNHAKPHSTSGSKLLMRQAVKKPAPSLKRSVKVQGALSVPKPSIGSLEEAAHRNERRLSHATHAAKSHAVSHFSGAPAANYYEVVARVAAPARADHAEHVTVRRVTPAGKARRPQTTAELLEHALREANSHEQPLFPKPRHHKKRSRLFARSHA